jgi:hypothetical protein
MQHLSKNIDIEIYPNDLGEMTWDEAIKSCQSLGLGWRLPTREELLLMFLNKDESYKDDWYWTSCEHDEYHAWYVAFKFGSHYQVFKSTKHLVRPVRNTFI